MITALVMALSIAWGLFLALPHAQEAIWQDEAVTLLFHASRGVIAPFQDYVSPNSHVGFTSLLSAWMQLHPDGVDLFSLRMLPLLFFAAAIPLAYAAARRLGGATCAAIATLIFATSPVSENFATQLRGYGPSWLFMALAFLSSLALAASTRHARRWHAAYLAACLGSVAILPTNVYWLSVIAGAASLSLYYASGPAAPAKVWRTVALLLAGPPLALALAYAGIWGELVGFAGHDFSPWGRLDLVAEWLRASSANFRWLFPLTGAGLAVAIMGIAKSDPRRSDTIVPLTVALGFLTLIVVMPNPPFPRTLVPFLPVWIAVMTKFLLEGARALVERRQVAAAAGGLVALGLLLFATPVGTDCRGAKGSGDPTHYDLCHQYFRDGYLPESILDAWAAEGAQRPIVSGYEAFYALQVLGAPARLIHYDRLPGDLKLAPLVVASDPSEFELILGRLGVDATDYAQLADTGYFKVYRPVGLR